MRLTMTVYHWGILGLVLDIVGAFFLTAEAIGIPRLVQVQERFLNRLIAVFLPETKDRSDAERVPVFLFLAGIAAGVLVLGGRGIIPMQRLVLGIAIGVVGYVVITILLQLGISSINFIHAHNEDGGVGLVGFGLLVAGFLLQVYANLEGYWQAS